MSMMAWGLVAPRSLLSHPVTDAQGLEPLFPFTQFLSLVPLNVWTVTDRKQLG